IRLDWRSGEARVLQQVARGDAQNQIDWVAWKTNERLIMSISTTRQATMRNDRSAHIRSSERVAVGVTRLVAINADGSSLRPMCEGQSQNLAVGTASTVLADVLPNDPAHVLIEAYGPNGRGLYRANVNSGRTERVEDGGWDGLGWAQDRTGAAVLRYEALPGGAGYRVFRRGAGERNWTQLAEFRGGEDTNNPEFGAVAPGPAGQVWVFARPPGQDRQGLYLLDAATGQYGAARYEHPQADFAGDVWLSRDQTEIGAACAVHQRRSCQYFNEDVGRHIRAVNAFFEQQADVTLVNMSDDGAVWLVHVQGPTTTPSYYIYDRQARAVLPVTATRAFQDEQLSPMEVVSYAGRDGAQLWGYLTTPPGAPAGGAPLVVYVHGGPEGRDYYGFDPMVQFFASRGYAVFQPQFRGSSGFGLASIMSGRRQWGQRMQDDVTDGVRHLIASGRAQAESICIVGGSYGGYAALAGATLTPDLYRCAIGFNGVYDLPDFLRWKALEEGRRSSSLDYWRNSIGDPNADRAMIEQVSPARQLSALRAPVLIIAGEFDWTVPVEQGRGMRDALQRAGANFRYVEYPRVGHTWGSWGMQERVGMLTEMERFLSEHLGGTRR
ncbi:MAG TPA: prolyl oligopeptidase family serine peptidase, partial [Terricaulis sp.]|nr:prolyl oligopeptidase family serine peptidase [Terricaulis sp.]